MAIIEITIIPIGTASTGLSSYVADIQQVLKQAPEPIYYEMTSMSTIIEGIWTICSKLCGDFTRCRSITARRGFPPLLKLMTVVIGQAP